MKSENKNFTQVGRGFTLTEIMVAMGIFVIIVYLTASMFYSFGSPATAVQARVFVITQARQTAERITWELMQASVTRTFLDAAERSIKFKLPVEYPNGSLKVSDEGELFWGNRYTEGNFIEYIWDNATGNLSRLSLDNSSLPITNTQTVIAQNVTNFDIVANNATYEFNLSISLDSYMGVSLRFPVTYNTSFSVTVQN
ncbi:MAG: prepilin-type N-terminal cleavage/methylation domain-containing protein [Candidatus Omnitrophota bacterium]